MTVVGGGVVGLTTAVVCERHARATGAEPTVQVLERASGLGQGSTGAAGFGLRPVYRHPANVALARRGLDFWSNSGSVLAGGVGYRQNGYAFLAGTASTARTLAAEHARQQAHGFPATHHRPPAPVPDAPPLRYDEYEAVLYSPVAALASPGKVVRSLAATARRRDVTVRTDAPVTDLRNGTDPAVEVDGEWEPTDYIVNAAGGWAASVAAMVDTDLPVWTERRRLSRLDLTVSPDAPLVVDVDSGVYFLPDESGTVMAGGKLTPETRADPDAPDAFATGVDERWNEAFERASTDLWGALADATVEASRTGLYTMTESRVPIVDRDDRVVHVTGFSGHGIMQAPGAAAVVARLLADDEPPLVDPSLLARDRTVSSPDIQF